MIFILAFIVSYINIGLRAFQQKSVMRDKYWLIPPVSMCMAFCEVFIILKAIVGGGTWIIAVPIGLGSGFGCMTAMYLHNKYIK